MLTGVSLLALLTAQMSFQFAHAVPSLRQRVLMSAKLIGLAAPLALALFFFFPRIDGPLWGMPDDAAGARSGLSETMSPGTMANLAQSRDPAFRVRFDGAMPAPELLYWRGPVLGHYDGRTWTRLDARLRERTARQPLSLSQLSAAVNYEVTLEPTSSRWLFALEFPQSLPELDNNLASVSAEFELTATYPIDTRLRYRMTSYLGYRFRQQAMPDDAEYWLQLPEDSNPRALLAGLALRALGDPARRVDTVLQRFRREPYVYTLSPPLLGRDAVDDFLYGSRAGFCEHYAGAFVFLMRAAGVPARVVTGYQGGEANPLDGYVTVRQSDAHAWAEVWLGARGWVRVDPTAAVAPERVRSGIDAALPPRPPFGIAGLGRLMQFDGGNGWLAQLRHAAGAVNNGWNQWVLNYTPLRQRGVLEQVQASLLDWRLPAAVALLCAVLLLLRLFLRRRQNDPIDALYCALCTRLGRLGLVRGIDESPSSYAARVASAPALAPPVQAAAAEFLARYSAWRYAPRAPQAPPARAAPLAATLKRLLSQVR
jgi:transglutaminase-like putative cysteine protease